MVKYFKEIWSVFKKEGFLFLLFLAACFTHNMDSGSIVYVALSIVLLLVFFVKGVKRFFDSVSILLILFSISYVVLMPNFEIADAARLLVGPVVLYLYGRYFVHRANYSPQIITKGVILMIICISFPVWWAVVNNMLSGNIISTTSIEGSRWLTTWGQSNMVAATTYGVIASFGLCGFGYFFASKNKFKGFDSIALLICSILSLLITTYLINRSGIVIIVLTTFLAILFGLKGSPQKTIIILIPIVGILTYAFYHISFGGAGEILEAYSERSTITEGGDRTWRWIDALGRLFTSPLGWSNEDIYTYVHNMWLDIARVSGIIPFVFFTTATIKIVKTNISLFNMKNSKLSMLLVLLFASVFLSYMIEPVIEANIFYLMIFTWIWGIEREVEYEMRRKIVLTE